MNVGIIGCGNIARIRHAHEYSRNPDVVISGFYDLSVERAEGMVQSFGGRVFSSVEALLSDNSIDAVSVCVSNKDHASITVAALESGKHVLCEKPMAVTMADCETMAAAAKKSEKRLLIGHNQRLAPAHKKAKKILDSGDLGRVLTFRSTFGHKGPEMWSSGKSDNTWFFMKDSAVFGSLADLGIHKIDLIRYLVGGHVREVFATLSTLNKKFSDGRPIEVDDNSIEILTFDSGAVGTIVTSWTYYGAENNATTLYCEKGIIKLYENPNYSLEIEYPDGGVARFEEDRLRFEDDAQQVKSSVIDVFVQAVTHGIKTQIDVDEILESMRVMFACVDSSQKKAPVTLC